jgi:hypothetical protein
MATPKRAARKQGRIRPQDKQPVSKRQTRSLDEPFILSPRAYREWRDKLAEEGRTPFMAYQDAVGAIFRIIEWSILTGAVGMFGAWARSNFLIVASTFLMVILTVYILGYILSMGRSLKRPINLILMGFVAVAVLFAASNLTRQLVLFGWQQLQDLPPPKDRVQTRIPF